MLRDNPFYYAYSKKQLRALCVNPHADLDLLDKNNVMKLWNVARFRRELIKLMDQKDCPFTKEEIFSKKFTKADLPPDWCLYILKGILKEEKKL